MIRAGFGGEKGREDWPSQVGSVGQHLTGLGLLPHTSKVGLNFRVQRGSIEQGRTSGIPYFAVDNDTHEMCTIPSLLIIH